MALVSAVIPTRNRPVAVIAAVKSVLQQTFRDVEAVVVIDGPDRATEEALREIEDPRLRVVALEDSVGGSEARNIGARLATGYWIGLLDDDDEWLPEKLERQLQAAKGSPYELIVSQFYQRDEYNNRSLWPQRFPLENEPLSEYMFCTVGNVFQTSTLLCTRSLFLRMPFTRGLKRLQDWDWVLRLMTVTGIEVTCVSEPLTIYNVDTTTPTISKKVDWRFTLNWANENKHLMTPKAYRGLLGKKCAPDAAIQGADSASVWMLFKASLRGCGLQWREPAMFIVYYALPPQRRLALGNAMRRCLSITRVLRPTTAK
jgi:glycosyltransferase involved in cell wall biosynthesis